MCCIFTCCGWMIDLIQRAWVFLMSCCMCSAVCMSVMTASMSGIAMGYNYSLAEYIDMKETNVSVFLKRGIFDDDIGSDMGFRRAGHGSIAGLVKEQELANAEPEEGEILDRSGRRLDDSVLQSNDNNNFEGSLMKLTVKPPAATAAASTFRGDEGIEEVLKKYPTDSLDQLKAIQSLMNMRKSNQQRVTINYDKTTSRDPRSNNIVLGRRMNIEPDNPKMNQVVLNKADLPYEHMVRANSIRDSVPSSFIGASEHWFLPKNLERTMGRTMFPTDIYDNVPDISHTYPTPIRYKTEVVRPTLATKSGMLKITPILGPDEIPKREMDTRRLDNSELNRVKDKLLMDKAMFPSFKKMESGQSDNQGIDKSEEVDYEEEAKRGIRIRKKRNIFTTSERLIVKQTRYTVPDLLFDKYIKIENVYNLQNETESKNETDLAKRNNFTKDNSDGITPKYININNTQFANKIYIIKNESVWSDDTIVLSKNNRTVETSNNVFNKLNDYSPSTVKTKTGESIISFLKSLLN